MTKNLKALNELPDPVAMAVFRADRIDTIIAPFLADPALPLTFPDPSITRERLELIPFALLLVRATCKKSMDGRRDGSLSAPTSAKGMVVDIEVEGVARRLEELEEMLGVTEDASAKSTAGVAAGKAGEGAV